MKNRKNAVMTGVQNRGPHWFIYNVDTWTPTNWQPVPDGKSGEFEDSPAQTRSRELARARGRAGKDSLEKETVWSLKKGKGGP